jgi:hypothetical protein
MRRLAVLVLAAALAACSGEASVPQGEAQAAEPTALMGQYRAASDTARVVTGDVSIERGGLIFDKGVVLYTRVLSPRRGYDRIARDGDSYAAVAVGAADLTVELRRVTEQRIAAAGHGLCGDDAPGYIALAYEARATQVTLLVFAGDEPPGPDATQSRLCATYAYAAPSGARTRQGVVLY